MRRRVMVVAALAVVLAGCSAKPETVRYTMESRAMEPTIAAGAQLTVPVGEPRPPVRGDIVVIRVPEGVGAASGLTAGEDIVRRVVGVGGDTVACCDVNGRIAVNGVGLDEPYVVVHAPLTGTPGTCAASRFDAGTVPAGQLFVLGDQRRVAVDSRCLGPMPASAVVAVLGPVATVRPAAS